MIKEYYKGHHQDNLALEEDYLDWFFLSYFGKGSNYWRTLSEEKLEAILILENEKENKKWNMWVKIFKALFSK